MNNLTELAQILLPSLIVFSLVYLGLVFTIANKQLSKAKEDHKLIKALSKCPPHEYSYISTRDGEYLQCIKCNFVPKDNA